MLQYLPFLLFLFPVSTPGQQVLPDLFPYKKGELWGFADHTGKIVIPAQVVSVEPFSYNIGLFGDTILTRRPAARVGLAGKEEIFININGTPMLPDFPAVRELYVHKIEGTKWLQVSGYQHRPERPYETGYCSLLMDADWKVALYTAPVVFSAVSFGVRPYEHRPVVQTMQFNNWDAVPPSGKVFCMSIKEQLYGLLSAGLDTIIPVRYRGLSNISDGVVVAVLDSVPGRSLLLDEHGKLLKTIPYEVRFRIADGRIAARKSLPNQQMTMYPDTDSTRRWGFIDLEGTVVIPFQYLNVKGFYQGIALGERSRNQWDILDTNGKVLGRLSVADRSGDFCIIEMFPFDLIPWQGGFFYKQKDQAYWEVLSPGMQDKLPYRFSDVNFGPLLFPHTNIIQLTLPNGGYMLVSKDRKILAKSDIEPDNVQHPSGKTYYRLKQNGKVFLANEQFQDMTSSKYDSVGAYWYFGLMTVEKDGYLGVIDTAFQEIVAPTHESIGLPENPGDNFIKVYNYSGALGLLTRQGKNVLPKANWLFGLPDDIGLLSAETVLLGKSEKGYWLCNGTGNCKNLGFAFDSIYAYWGSSVFPEKELVFLTKKSDRIGLIDASGNQLFAPVFRDIVIQQDRKAVVSTDSSVAFYDLRPFRQLMPFSKFAITWGEGGACFQATSAQNTASYGFWHPGKAQMVWGDLIQTGRWGSGLLPVRKACDNRRFFINQDLNEVFSDNFYSIESFGDGLAQVSTKDSVGIIDTAGRWVIKRAQNRLLRHSGGFIYEVLDKPDARFGLYDRRGNLLDNQIYSICSMWPGLGVMYEKKIEGASKYFMRDTAGNLVIDACDEIERLDSAVLYRNEYEVLELGTQKQGRYRSFQRNRAVPAGENLWFMSHKYISTGLFRGDGTCIVPIAYDGLELHPEDQRILLWKRNGSIELFDYNGHSLVSSPPSAGRPQYISGKGLLWWANGTGRFVNLDGIVFEEP